MLSIIVGFAADGKGASPFPASEFASVAEAGPPRTQHARVRWRCRGAGLDRRVSLLRQPPRCHHAPGGHGPPQGQCARTPSPGRERCAAAADPSGSTLEVGRGRSATSPRRAPVRTEPRPATGPPATSSARGVTHSRPLDFGISFVTFLPAGAYVPGLLHAFILSTRYARPMGQAVFGQVVPGKGPTFHLGVSHRWILPSPASPLGSMLALQENAPHPRRQARGAHQMPGLRHEAGASAMNTPAPCGAGSPDVGRRSAVEPSAPPMDGMRAPDEGLPAPDLRARLPPTLSSVRRDTDGTVGDAHRHDNRLRMAIGAVGRIAS